VPSPPFFAGLAASPRCTAARPRELRASRTREVVLPATLRDTLQTLSNASPSARYRAPRRRWRGSPRSFRSGITCFVFMIFDRDGFTACRVECGHSGIEPALSLTGRERVERGLFDGSTSAGPERFDAPSLRCRAMSPFGNRGRGVGEHAVEFLVHAIGQRRWRCAKSFQAKHARGDS